MARWLVSGLLAAPTLRETLPAAVAFPRIEPGDPTPLVAIVRGAALSYESVGETLNACRCEIRQLHTCRKRLDVEIHVLSVLANR